MTPPIATGVLTTRHSSAISGKCTATALQPGQKLSSFHSRASTRFSSHVVPRASLVMPPSKQRLVGMLRDLISHSVREDDFTGQD